MSQLHVLFKSGEERTIYALADVQPNPGNTPPADYPPVIWASSTGISGVGAPLHAHFFTEAIAGMWTTED